MMSVCGSTLSDGRLQGPILNFRFLCKIVPALSIQEISSKSSPVKMKQYCMEAKKKILSRRTIAIIEDIYGKFIAYPAIKLQKPLYRTISPILSTNKRYSLFLCKQHYLVFRRRLRRSVLNYLSCLFMERMICP